MSYISWILVIVFSHQAVGNYAFAHHAGHLGGPSFHSEVGDVSGRKVGSYGVKDADGKVRVVEYVADAGGFKANIKTSEKLAKDHKDAANVKTTQAEHVLPVPHVYGYPFAYPAHYYYVPV